MFGKLGKIGKKATGGAPGRSGRLAAISTAEGMQDSIPTQGQGAPGAVNPMRVAALKKMRKGK